MKKIYIFAALTVILLSCSTKVKYLGNNYPATTFVELFIDKNSIKRPYEVIGRGYVQSDIGVASAEAVQRKAIRKGQQNGAHGVIIEDYFVIDNTTSITTPTDSSGNHTRRVVSGSSANPHFAISFIRFTDKK